MTAMLSRVDRHELAELQRDCALALREIGHAEDAICKLLGIGQGEEDRLLRDHVTDFASGSTTINYLVARVRTEQARRKP